ncbi:hypothetical protein LTS18_001328, partial [Coniosporium uncinatum]
MPTKSVAIIGAGPAGLVAAKNLLRCSTASFNVTIFEKKHHVGGMWGLEPGQQDGIVSPDMPTNLSRFTVAFSDLDWQSVDISEAKSEKRPLPMFPRAWQVGKYLQEYRRRYVPEDCIRFGSCVDSVQENEDLHKERRWSVRWTERADSDSVLETSNQNGRSMRKTQEGTFDHLIVASGFFSTPRPSSFQQPTSSTKTPYTAPKVIHSSQFRHISDIALPRDTPGSIVVIGGGMSGAEAAGNLAFQISNSKYSKLSTDFTNYQIYHVFSRPFYVLPTYLPQDPVTESKTQNRAPSFVPLDLTMFDLGRRPQQGPILPSNGLMSPERATSSHKFLRSVLGDDQSSLGSEAL